MLLTGLAGPPEGRGRESAHVIVCGNEKGGSGKSTTAAHIAVALLCAGHSVATIDLDGRQLTLTRYFENRRRWSAKAHLSLPIPHHFHVPPAYKETVSAAESEEFRRLTDGLADIENSHDFVVIDTPGSDTFLNRLAHRIADTLVTPMNDSFIDFDVLARIDPISNEIVETSQYANAVREARRERRNADNSVLDWVVVRNRLSSIASRNAHKMDACLKNLSARIGFRIADGISERVIFREFFPIGLTALDDFEAHVLGTRPTLSHLAARQEIRQLITSLRLPTDAVGRRRAEIRRQFVEASSRPLLLPDIFAK